MVFTFIQKVTRENNREWWIHVTEPWIGDTQSVEGMVIAFKLFVIIEDREIGSQEI